MVMNKGTLNSPVKKFYFIKDLENLIGRSRLTLRRWWTSGKFPKPFKLNGVTLAWDTATIDSWCDAQRQYAIV